MKRLAISLLPIGALIFGQAWGAEGGQLRARIEALEGLVAALQTQVLELQGQAHTDPDPTGVLTKFSRNGDDIFVDGANLHITNGLNDTRTTNGLGNIIIGYNESRGPPSGDDDRSGSHMLVVGSRLNYSSYGGIVVGDLNFTSGTFSSVSGGQANHAGEAYSSVSGGLGNRTFAVYSSITGGTANRTFGEASSVTGGRTNTTTGQNSSISGGEDNETFAYASSVSGGRINKVSGNHSAISGGTTNEASGPSSSVTGGAGNDAVGDASSVTGGADNIAIGGASSVSGGRFNTATDNFSHPDSHTQ